MGAGVSRALDSAARDGPFVPTPGDVRLAHAYLSSPGLLPPAELAWEVLDYAEYWAAEVFESKPLLQVSAGMSGRRQQEIVLRTPPIFGGGPFGLERCVRRISITTVSKDQGFSSFPQHTGTREASSSWFEVALLRQVATEATSDTPEYRRIVKSEVVRNIHAGRTFAEATRVFTVGDALVDEARRGDRLVLFALAQYPAWVNSVKECRIVVESMM